MADVDENSFDERTGITFAPPAGIGTVLYPGTPDDAKTAITRALTQRSWLTIPPVDGAPPLHVGPYALRHVSMIATILFERKPKDEQTANNGQHHPALVLPGGAHD